MYNNIKNFINPRYATLFLFCIVSLLAIIFIKSRAESFVGNDLKDIRNIRDDIKDLKGDVKSNSRDVKTASETIQSVSNSATSNIKNLQDKKLDINDFNKTLLNDTNFNKKLNASEFDATLDKNAKFNGKLNANDFDATLDKNAKFNSKLNTSDFETTLGNSDQLKAKLNASDFSSTLSKDPAILKLQTDLKGVPTSDNIGTVVNQQVQAKVGDINAANETLKKNFTAYSTQMKEDSANFLSKSANVKGEFNQVATAKITELSDKANDKLGEIKDNAQASTNAIKQTAATHLNLLDSNYQSKIGELSSLKAGAESARDDALDAKSSAEEAKFNTQKMYDDVFKEASSRVVTQSNVYRDGLKFNEKTGFYESFGTMFNTREGLVDGATFDAEKAVITNLNDFNAKYYIWLSCKNGKCPTGKNEAKTREELVSAADVLGRSIDALKAAYPTTRETDNTSAIIQKAQEIDQLRRDLDTKMDALIKSKTRTDEPTMTYDSTVYAGILWSILGTSLLFYVFAE